MSELNDIKVDNEEFWWEALDDFASDDEITVVEISRDDLDNNSTDGLKALGQVDMGEWDDLAEILNEKDGMFYTKNTNKPYSGPIFSLFDADFIISINS